MLIRDELNPLVKENMDAHVEEASNNLRDATETLLLILPSFFFTVIAVLVSSALARAPRTLTFLLEFVIIVYPVILNVTVLSKYVTNVVVIICFLLGMHLIVWLIYVCCKRVKNIKPTKKVNPNKVDYITNCRSTINVLSVIAILAVDFKIFPSRFSKTSLTGFSLMDVGVGLFVFANGIVAPEVRGKKDHIKNSIKGSAILLVLGISRLILTKLTHYKVSDSEYGLHWNFFITLAFTKIFSSCILNVIKVKYVLVSATLLSVAHETLLQLSFKRWVFYSHHRDTFIDANKEGLVSTSGFVALYLYSIYFMYNIKQTDKSFKSSNIKFFLWCAFTLTITIFCNCQLEVSRRLANVGYIFWILFIGILMMWLFSLSENGLKFLLGRKLKYYICAPHLYEAVNYNGLIFFLVGNVLTGLVNLTIKTKTVNALYSLLILVGYMLLNCSLVFVLYVKQWKLKL